MKRSASIEALIKKGNADFSALRQAYEASLHEKRIRDDMRVDIKNIFENLRSSLDYMAHEVFDACCAGAKKPERLYFPIRPTEQEYKQAVARDFPGLEAANAAVYEILENAQPFRDPWLGQFNRLNNDNKHQDLVEQTRTEARHVTVTGQSGSVSWRPGVTFSGDVRVMGVPIDTKTQLPVPNSLVRTEVVTWVDFQFKDAGISVLPFLETSLRKVQGLFQDLTKHI